MSYSRLCRAVRTSTDKPCPTSIATSSASPCRGRSRAGNSSGNHSSSSSGLPGTPRGSSSQNTDSNASGSANQRDSGSQAIASGLSAMRASHGHSASKHHAAARHGNSPNPACRLSANTPNRASGITTRLHHGTAARLANGPANEAWPNNTTVNGSRPSVATACAAAKSCSSAQRRGPCSAGRHHSNQATPAKLSQKPAPRIASGSSSNSAMQPSARVSASRCRRRRQRAATSTAIITAVRKVGNAKPVIAA